jgi:hypothetical protein
VVQYLNQFCLFRLVAWMRANYSIKHHQLEIRQIFEAVATLDASRDTGVLRSRV